MDIEDYILAAHSNCKIIEPSESKYPKVVESIISSLEEEQLRFKLIKSSSCKSEILELNGEKWVIFDFQPEIYMSALQLSRSVSGNNENDFEKNLFKAMSYIACSEIDYCGNSHISNQIRNLYSLDAFDTLTTTPKTFARVFFIIFHEWAHAIADADPKSMEYIYIDVDQVYGELDTQRDDSDLFFSSNREECAVDTVAAIYAQSIIDNDVEFSISVGNYLGFLNSALICIHQLTVIDEIKNIVKLALRGDAYEKKSHTILYQRLRVTRYLFSRIIVDTFGEDAARKSWDKFSVYLEDFSNQKVEDSFENLYNLILSSKEKST